MSHQSHFKPCVFAAIVLLFLVFPLCSLQAALNFSVGAKFNGNGTTYGPGPWVNISIIDVGPGQVDLTISAVGLSGGEKIGGVYLNLDPLLDPADLVFSDPIMTGTFEAPTINHSPANEQKADGDGGYDILFAFNTDGANKAFNGGESVEYTISLTSLAASSFNFLSIPSGGMGAYVTTVDIRSPGGVSGNTVWATTPEPATLVLLAAGALAALRRRNR